MPNKNQPHVPTNKARQNCLTSLQQFQPGVDGARSAGHGATNGYDAKGNLTNAVNALGQATRFLYDAQARLVSQVDAAGNLSIAADAAGRFVEYEYDVLNRRVKTLFLASVAARGRRGRRRRWVTTRSLSLHGQCDTPVSCSTVKF